MVRSVGILVGTLGLAWEASAASEAGSAEGSAADVGSEAIEQTAAVSQSSTGMAGKTKAIIGAVVGVLGLGAAAAAAFFLLKGKKDKKGPEDTASTSGTVAEATPTKEEDIPKTPEPPAPVATPTPTPPVQQPVKPEQPKPVVKPEQPKPKPQPAPAKVNPMHVAQLTGPDFNEKYHQQSVQDTNAAQARALQATRVVCMTRPDVPEGHVSMLDERVVKSMPAPPAEVATAMDEASISAGFGQAYERLFKLAAGETDAPLNKAEGVAFFPQASQLPAATQLVFARMEKTITALEAGDLNAAQAHYQAAREFARIQMGEKSWNVSLPEQVLPAELTKLDLKPEGLGIKDKAAKHFETTAAAIGDKPDRAAVEKATQAGLLSMQKQVLKAAQEATLKAEKEHAGVLFSASDDLGAVEAKDKALVADVLKDAKPAGAGVEGAQARAVALSKLLDTLRVRQFFNTTSADSKLYAIGHSKDIFDAINLNNAVLPGLSVPLVDSLVHTAYTTGRLEALQTKGMTGEGFAQYFVNNAGSHGQPMYETYALGHLNPKATMDKSLGEATPFKPLFQRWESAVAGSRAVLSEEGPAFISSAIANGAEFLADRTGTTKDSLLKGKSIAPDVGEPDAAMRKKRTSLVNRRLKKGANLQRDGSMEAQYNSSFALQRMLGADSIMLGKIGKTYQVQFRQGDPTQPLGENATATLATQAETAGEGVKYANPKDAVSGGVGAKPVIWEDVPAMSQRLLELLKSNEEKMHKDKRQSEVVKTYDTLLKDLDANKSGVAETATVDVPVMPEEKPADANKDPKAPNK